MELSKDLTEFIISVDIFSIFLIEREIYSRDKIKKKSLLTNFTFWLIDLYILPNCHIKLKVAAAQQKNLN